MKQRILWTKELVELEAKKYERWVDFYNNCEGAYRFALRNNILEEVCGHLLTANGMKYTDSFTKEANIGLEQ